jgi:hypothetical protein
MASFRRSSRNRRLISARVLFLANFLFTVFTTVMVVQYLDGRQNRSTAESGELPYAGFVSKQGFGVSIYYLLTRLLGNIYYLLVYTKY